MGKRFNIREKFIKVSSSIQSNKYIGAISNGLGATMPMLLAGSLFTLIDAISIPAYQAFLESSGLKVLTAIIPTVTTSIIALYAVFTIANSLTDQFKQDGRVAGLLSLMAFLIVTPFGVMQDETVGIGIGWLGAKGLFVAMFVALITARIYVLVLDKNLYIKMPKGVPSTIEKSMAALVPGVVIIFVFLIIRGLFNLTSFGNVHAFVFNFIQVPLTQLGSSPFAYLIAVLMIGVLWFFGVHGALLVLSVMSPIWTPLRLENLEAFQLGLPLPNVVIGTPFYTVFASLGGTGATLGLAIAMLFAKSKQYKTLGKLAIIPSICGINEPLLFGLPIVLNIKLLVPFIVTPLITSSLGLAATYLGIIPKLRGLNAPTGTPVVVRGFLEGGWKVAVFQVLLVVISFLIYYYFFKKMDQEAYSKEIAAASESVETA